MVMGSSSICLSPKDSTSSTIWYDGVGILLFKELFCIHHKIIAGPVGHQESAVTVQNVSPRGGHHLVCDNVVSGPLVVGRTLHNLELE